MTNLETDAMSDETPIEPDEPEIPEQPVGPDEPALASAGDEADTGACELPEGVEMVMPGDNVKMVVSLINPVAMDEGLRFAIREGGRTVGAGVVAKILK